MRKILFVDDEQMVLDAMRRMIRGMHTGWQVDFRPGGKEALEAMASESFDVVVSDMKMPGMSGAALLAEVKRRHPGVIRIILSGHSDKESILQSVGVTHQYLAKPCDPEKLRETIMRTVAIQGILGNDALRDLITQMHSLPSLPSLFQDIVARVQDPAASLEAIGRVIAKDVAMSARVLQLVNSAYFGLAQRMASVERAVSYLGLETITSLVLGMEVFSQMDERRIPGFHAEALWDHSMRTATLARAIATDAGLDRIAVDDSFTAGMLHDVGLLVLASRLPDALGAVLEALGTPGTPVAEAERAVAGVAHADVGAYLLGLWGLPVSIIEAVAFHHRPLDAERATFDPLGAVHVAGALVSESADSASGAAWRVSLDEAYVSKTGVSGRVPAWRATAAESLAKTEVR